MDDFSKCVTCSLRIVRVFRTPIKFYSCNTKIMFKWHCHVNWWSSVIPTCRYLCECCKKSPWCWKNGIHDSESRISEEIWKYCFIIAMETSNCVSERWFDGVDSSFTRWARYYMSVVFICPKKADLFDHQLKLITTMQSICTSTFIMK